MNIKLNFKNCDSIHGAATAELAEAELNKPDPVLVNFAPDALRPGNSIRPNKRQPGSNLSGFRDMASDLFKSN